MRNNKPIPPKELQKGMRVKIRWNGKWWGYNKKYKWLKGTIVKVYKQAVEISLRNTKRTVNHCLIFNLADIYKQL